MIIPIKNKEGKIVGWRPPLIGFVKNDYLRRSLMIAFLPYTMLMTIAVNLLVTFIQLLIMLFKSFYLPIKSGLFSKWALWDKPRTKDESPDEQLTKIAKTQHDHYEESYPRLSHVDSLRPIGIHAFSAIIMNSIGGGENPHAYKYMEALGYINSKIVSRGMFESQVRLTVGHNNEVDVEQLYKDFKRLGFIKGISHDTANDE